MPKSFPTPQRTQSTPTIPVFSRWMGSWRISLERRPFDAEHLRTAYGHRAVSWQRTIGAFNTEDAYQTVLFEALLLVPALLGQPDLRVLDCGCGDGALTAALATLCPVPIEASLVDLSEHMLDEAAKRLANTVRSLDVRRADARALPFPEETFDLVMCSHMLEHVGDPVAVLREMTRVLRPGGALIMVATRRSVSALPIRLAWRTHGLTSDVAADWTHAAGLTHVAALPPTGERRFDRLSLATLAIKPVPGRRLGGGVN